jgi:ABC-type nitrate/sulfonate/bicarbonate transport system permease component
MKESAMLSTLYPKNVPNIERGLRIVIGFVLIVLALYGTPLIGDVAPVVAGLLILSAIGLVVTGFIGWCPACAMVGRKLKTPTVVRSEK